MKKILNSKKIIITLSFLGLYLLSTGVSLAVFSFINQEPEAITDANDLEDARAKLEELPKTEECPINGGMFSKVEKEIWSGRRPVLAMVENSLDSRPQSGFSAADVVYEAVAEGGITRFLGVFYCAGAKSNLRIAPIRSARIYYVNLAAGYGNYPIFLHQGAANRLCGDCPSGLKPTSQVATEVDAYTALDKLGWRAGSSGNDLDGGYNIAYPVVVRNQYRLSQEPAAWEHSVEAFLDKVYEEAGKRGFNYKDSDNVAWDKEFRSWTFSDDAAASSTEADEISFGFWSNKSDYDVSWKYEKATNSYLRENGGKPATDWEGEKTQITAKNVVIMFAKERGPVDSEKHMMYEVIGTNDAIIFQNGEVIKGTWKKSSQVDREIFYDKNGKEISFVRGPIWIEVVPDGNDIDY